MGVQRRKHGQWFLRFRRLSVVSTSIIALLSLVACGGSPFSIFNQQPQPGSGAAITPQTASSIHPLWRYQTEAIGSGVMTSTKGMVYVSYESNESIVGKQSSVDFRPTKSRRRHKRPGCLRFFQWAPALALSGD